MENGGGPSKGESFLSRMALNDNKAGMEGLDRDKINKIIMETSKGSRFYENELKKERQVNQRIEKMLLQKAQITEQQLKRAQEQVDTLTSDLERSRDLSRVIVHVDMDAFYAAVEMRDCPDLKEKPMAVGCMSMLSTSNYHARKFGVRAAMPGFIAKKLCPDLVIVPLNFDKYKAVSAQIREIFADYDPHFQPLSLDEAYLDFTDHLEKRRSWPDSLRTHPIRSASTADEVQAETQQEVMTEAEGLSPVLFDDSPESPPCPQDSRGTEVEGHVEVFGTSAEEAVREMRFRIEQKTALTASAGIAPNMMLAKVCSEQNKPNGQYRLLSNRQAIMEFVQNLPVRKVFGIGKVSEKMLGALGITSCAHLCQQMALLSLLFSETAWHHFIRISLGLGATHIERDGERKSMSTERTFREMSAVEDQLSLCRELCQDLAEDLKKEGLKGKTVTLKLKNVNFEVKSRAWTLPCAVSTVDEIFAVAKDLLKAEIENVSPQPLRLRLMGVRLSSFVSSDEKKPLQKSIVGFLQQGGADSGGSLQVHIQKPEKSLKPPTQNGTSACTPLTQQRPQEGQRQGDKVPWLVRLKGQEVGRHGEPQQSFFQRAQAQRLRLQAESETTPADRDKGDPSTLSPSGAHTQQNGVSPTKTQSKSKFFDSNVEPFTSTTENDLSIFPTEAQASTSGWRGTDTEGLTCPVCFSKVETTDLNVFNRHIDQCLSGFATKPVEVADSASESDMEADRDHSAWNVVEEEELDAERGGGKGKGKAKQKEDSGITKASVSEQKWSPSKRTGSKSESTVPTLASLPTSTEHLQQNNDKKLKNGEHSPQVPVVHDRSPMVKETSHDNPKTSALTCPVCQVTQDTEDLTVFNRHIDLCLNQEVLHELGGRSSSSSMAQKAVSLTNSKVKERDGPRLRAGNNGKTKRQGSPTPPAKKGKAHGSTYTIDKFFR